MSSRKKDLDEKATVRFETMPGKQGQMKEGLNPLSREYIIDKINLRRVQNAWSCIVPVDG